MGAAGAGPAGLTTAGIAVRSGIATPTTAAAAIEPVASTEENASTSAIERARTRGATGQARTVARCHATRTLVIASRQAPARSDHPNARTGVGAGAPAMETMTRSTNGAVSAETGDEAVLEFMAPTA